MKKRAFKFILLFYTAGVMLSCLDCADKHYDYVGISLSGNTNIIHPGEDLRFTINKEGTYYLTNAPLNPQLFNTAYAYSCDYEYFAVYPLTNISIKSTADFNSEFPAGSELKSIFKAYGHNEDREYLLDFADRFSIEDINESFFFLEISPEIDSIHRFTFEYTKSNGEVHTAISDVITWE